jgi:hypothetical protein
MAIPKVTVTFDADLDQLKSGVKGATNEVDGFGTKIGEFSKKAAIAFAAAAAAAGAFALKVGVDAVKAASDLAETVSKVGVLFGDSATEINKFAATAATKLGQTKQQALDAAATFATFGKAAGLSGQNLVDFSTGFTSLASDLASFNNTTPEQAINAIGSALRGEAEPLRAYGVLLDDASLRQAALELGITNTTKNALTPQQKVLAAQKLIYEQTGAAQGDFERTSDGLANKTRILTAQLENAKTTIGDALLPIVLKLATFFSDNVIPIVEKLAGAFSNKTGGLGESFDQVVETIKTFVTPIFEGVVSLFNNIKKAVTENIDNFQSFLDVVKYVAPLVASVIGAALKVIAPIANAVIDVFGAVIGAIKPVLNFVIDSINQVIRGLNIISPFKDIPYIPKIGATAVSTSSSTGNGTSLPSSSLPSGFTPSTPTPTPTPTTVTTSTPALAAVAASVSNVVSGNFNAGTFRAKEAASMGTVINLTVTGAFEPEGTARTIIDTLNNSYYRGTGGGSNLQGIA